MSPFGGPLREGVLIRRYRRFLADVSLDGQIETVHCCNPGAMTGLAAPGSAVLISDPRNPRRKLRHTWELVRAGRTWVCVNTAVGNRVVRRWLESGHLFGGFDFVRPEVKWGKSRFDFALGDEGLLEVKTVTLKVKGIGAFPDAPTERGRRHLDALARIRKKRRVLLYFVARGDVSAVRPADEIDPLYGRALRRAARAGVEIVAVSARFTRRGVAMGPRLEVIL